MNGHEKIVHGAGGVNAQLRQICIDYASLVDIREITIDEIRFFYEPLIEGLCERQRAMKGK